MNERIKQLYEQAHIERRQEYFSSVVDPTIKSVSVTRHFDPNLFAELIVRECYALVDYENKQFIKAQFKDIFGVEADVV
jgi:hypothetical protein